MNVRLCSGLEEVKQGVWGRFRPKLESCDAVMWSWVLQPLFHTSWLIRRTAHEPEHGEGSVQTVTKKTERRTCERMDQDGGQQDHTATDAWSSCVLILQAPFDKTGFRPERVSALTGWAEFYLARLSQMFSQNLEQFTHGSLFSGVWRLHDFSKIHKCYFSR